MSRKKVFVGLMGTLFLLATFLSVTTVVASAETTLEFWHPYTQATRMEAMKKSAREFEQVHPGVTVRIETVPFPKIPEKWATAYAAGTLPDLMGVTTWNAMSMENVGVIRYADSIIEQMGGQDKVFNCGGLIDKLWRFKGNTLGMPLYGTARTPAYRRDLLEEKGLMPPVSWDEWIEVATKLTDPPKQYGLVQMWDPSDIGGTFTLWIFMLSNGGTFFDENGNLRFNTSRNVEAVKQVMELYQVGSPPGDFSFTMREYFNLFTSGKSALSVNACGFLAPKFERELPDLAAKNALGFTRAPVRLQRGWQAGLAGFVFLKGDNEELAAEFGKFLYEPDRYIRWVHAVPVGMIPVTNSSIRSPKYWDNPIIKKYNYCVKASIEGLGKGSEVASYYGLQPGSPVITEYGIIETMLQKIAIGQVSVEEGVIWAEKEIRKRMEERER